MSVSATNKPASSATSIPPNGQPAPRSERELLAREAAAARAALANVWQQFISELKACPRIAVEEHPLGSMLATVTTGAVVGAGAAHCVRDRAEHEADRTCRHRHHPKHCVAAEPAEPDEPPRRTDPRSARERLKDKAKEKAREKTKQAATSLLTSTLLQAAPAFIMGFMGAGAPQQGEWPPSDMPPGEVPPGDFPGDVPPPTSVADVPLA